MVASLSTLVLLLCVISTVAWYSCLYFLKLNNNTQKKTLPPGPPGLPIFGNLLSLDPDLHTYFAGLAQIHGPILKLRLGSKLSIVITSPAMAREDNRRKGRDLQRLRHSVDPVLAEWRMLRKVCVLKMLSNPTLDSVYDLRRNEMRKTVSYLYGRVGSAVNIGEQVFLTVMNVITNMMWGGAVEGAERESMRGGVEGAGGGDDAAFGKAKACVEKQMHALVARFDGMFERMIDRRTKVEGQDGESREMKDFLQFLLKLKDEAGDSKTPLTIIHVKALLMDMVTGGTDTSSNTIEFAMAEMMHNPEIMKRVQEELEVVVGKDNMVEESHIHKLSYLQAVMKETLRLHPVLPLLIPHCPSETTNVGGYRIPKGSQVFLNVWAIHRDPSIWENPLKFDPTRFLDAKWDFSGNDFNYFPFGSGRRICAGIAMAERTVLYFLATLLHLFDWTIPQGEKLDVSEKFGIVLKKKIPLVAIPTPRLSNPDLYN
ncbi:Cytochrome P450 76C4 [Glycine soja]|nr:Cytochrome P450 76C4 [Glycine soja]